MDSLAFIKLKHKINVSFEVKIIQDSIIKSFTNSYPTTYIKCYEDKIREIKGTVPCFLILEDFFNQKQ